MKIRALNNQDLFTITDILIAAVESGSSKIGQALSPELGEGKSRKLTKAQEEKEAEKSGIRVVTMVVRECWKYGREPLQAWFADLCGMTTKEYLKAPASVSIELVEFFTKDQGNRDFFSRALRVVRGANSTVNSFLAGLGLSDTTTD
jgi:hypothetical protein